ATTLAGGALEVELAVLHLSGLGQALAQGIEPVGLGLQLAQARSQGVALLLRLLAHLLQLTLLLRQLRFHALGGRRADSGAGADARPTPTARTATSAVHGRCAAHCCRPPCHPAACAPRGFLMMN